MNILKTLTQVPGEFDVDEQLASKKTPTSIGGAEGVMDAVDVRLTICYCHIFRNSAID